MENQTEILERSVNNIKHALAQVRKKLHKTSQEELTCEDIANFCFNTLLTDFGFWKAILGQKLYAKLVGDVLTNLLVRSYI